MGKRKVSEAYLEAIKELEEAQKKVVALFNAGPQNKYTSAVCFAYKIAEYIRRQVTSIDKNGKTRPLTKTGVLNALDIGNDDMTAGYLKGDYDDINIKHNSVSSAGYTEIDIKPDEQIYIEQCISDTDLQPYFDYLTNGYKPLEANNTLLKFSQVGKRAVELIAEQDEEKIRSRGSVADIFIMKSIHGWRDSTEIKHTYQIATEEEAKQALQALKLLD